MIAPGDRWGPFANNIETSERIARLRCLRAIVHLSSGPRGTALADLLHRAERDPDAIPAAVNALDRLASLDRRHILAAYAALNAPARPPRGSSTPEGRA